MIPTTQETIKAHLTHLRAQGLADNTIRDANRTLNAADAGLPNGLRSAYPHELTAWLANPAWSRQTRATYRQHLVRFYTWATRSEDPWLSYNPAAGLPRPQVRPGLPRPALDEQVHVAITTLDEPWRLHCILAAYEGLRCVEIARLLREQVSEQSVLVHGKGDRWAAVPTHPLVWSAVRDLPAGPLTRMTNGAPATAHWVSYSTRCKLRKAGLALSLHRFRHWFGTTIQHHYRDLRVTQTLLRHASPVSTAVYTEVADESRREAVGCLPDLTARAA